MASAKYRRISSADQSCPCYLALISAQVVEDIACDLLVGIGGA